MSNGYVGSIQDEREGVSVKIYMTRHGQTVWNSEKRMQGRLNSDLTELGVTNARLLGRHLKDVTFEAIYTSPSGRTKKTAELVRGCATAPIIPDDDLLEIYMGSWEGQRQTDVEKLYPDDFYAFWNAPHLYKPSESESFGQVQERAIRLLDKVTMKHSEGNILLVTHTVVIKTLLASLKGKPMEQLWDPPYLHDTCLSMIEVTEGKKKILLEADISHLPTGDLQFT